MSNDIENKINTKKLEDLFKEFKKLPAYKDSLITDGIICVEDYLKAEKKILFVQKEANDTGDGSWDLREFFRKEFKYNFSHRLAEWSYGILNNFPPLNRKIKPNVLHNELKKTAVVNVKKTGGGANSNLNTISNFVNDEKNKKLLIKQIELIAPDIIVAGLGRQTKILEDLLDIKLKISTYDIKIGKWNGIKVIDYYHPSYRVPRTMSYSLLQNVVNSEEFKNI